MATEPHQSFLAPGQRYVRAGRTIWRADNQLTILAVGKDLSGHVWATYRDSHGADSTAPATQFERAVAAGEIVPVIDGPMIRC